LISPLPIISNPAAVNVGMAQRFLLSNFSTYQPISQLRDFTFSKYLFNASMDKVEPVKTKSA
jgi:hypothetical protein